MKNVKCLFLSFLVVFSVACSQDEIDAQVDHQANRLNPKKEGNSISNPSKKDPDAKSNDEDDFPPFSTTLVPD